MTKKTPTTKQTHTTFDPLYGFITLNDTEKKIIQSPFYQRLRWIRQLGFSNYIFPGAEHNRFAHALGVMHMADRMIRSISKAVDDDKLYNVKATDKKTMFHKSVRMAALLHDIGTFPFSHTTEAAYITHGDSSFKKTERGKPLPNNHEHLGAFILKNTNFDMGITQILENDGYDTAEISKIVKGESKNLLANQLLHSEVDADRIDYLMRDAHYTGLKYGQFDREYILYHLTTVDAGGEEVLAIKEKALHTVEDFLIARFGWYSQIVRATEGAKFDIIAATVMKYLLEKNLAWQFRDLLKMVESDVERFYGFNDLYFMNLIHQCHLDKTIKDKKIAEMIKMLLYRQSPVTVHLPHLEESLVVRDEEGMRKREVLINKVNDTVSQFEQTIKEAGDGSEWILFDIPRSDITFVKSIKDIMNSRSHNNIMHERDPVKIVDRYGNARLLVESENSIIRILSRVGNFIPSVYMNDAAFELLNKKGLLKNAKAKVR